MSVAQALSIAAALCRTFEGVRLKPYLCPAAIPTIGIGSTHYEDGRLVALSDPPITLARAEALMMLTLARDYLPGVLRASPGLAEHPRALGALVDFAYNCGVPRYRASTLRRRVDAKDWQAAKDQLLKWTRGGGKILPGLVARRVAEGKLL
jgi:lysozyme